MGKDFKIKVVSVFMELRRKVCFVDWHNMATAPFLKEDFEQYLNERGIENIDIESVGLRSFMRKVFLIMVQQKNFKKF